MLNSKNSNKIISYFHDTKNRSVKIRLEITTPKEQRHTIIFEFANIYGIQINDINPHQNLISSIKKMNPDKFYDQFFDHLKPQNIIGGNLSPTNFLFSYADKNEFIKNLNNLSLSCFSIESEWGLNGFIITTSAKTSTNRLSNQNALSNKVT